MTRKSKEQDALDAARDAVPDQEPLGDAGAQPVSDAAAEVRDARAAFDAKMEAQLNKPEDKHYRPEVLVPMARHPNADVSMLGDASTLPLAARVGRVSVEHPRARMASAMHDLLGGREPASFTASELQAIAEGVGMQVDGSGLDGSVLKSDFVRAMDALGAAHPARRSADAARE